jgi:hypothetical protein
MKNKKIFVLIFILFMIVFPYFDKNYVFADDFDILGFKKIFAEALAGFFVLIFQVIHSILWFLNWLLAVIVDLVSNLNPFYKVNNQDPPVKEIWSILVYFSYIIIVFSALLAAYEWLFGNDVSAKRLIFNLIIVALIINFTYVLAKEAFEIVKKIEDGLVGKSIQDMSNPNNKIGVGTFIFNSLWQFDLYGALKEIFSSHYQEKNLIEKFKNISVSILLGGLSGAVALLFPPLVPFAILAGVGSIMLNKYNLDPNQWLGEVFTSIFIVLTDMVMFIILFVLAVLYVMRYIIIIFLVGVSSIAVASLAFPRFEKIEALRNIASRYNFFDTWLNEFVRWLLVIPIFVILVILGNTLKTNTLGQISLDQTNQSLNTIIQFVIVLALLSGWYIMSLVVANQLSGRMGKSASVTATGFLTGIGGLAAAGIGLGASRLFAPAISKMGKFLENTGDKLVSMGGPGFFGNMAFKLGTNMKQIGKQYSELPYKGDIEASKAAFKKLLLDKSEFEEQLKRETDEKKKQEILKKKDETTEKIDKLITDLQNRNLLPYLSEDIKNLDDKSLIALHKDPKILSKLYGNEKTKKAMLDRVSQLKDPGLAEVLETISEFSDKDYKDLKNQGINSILESQNKGKKTSRKFKEIIIKNPEKIENLVDNLSEDNKDELIEIISKFDFEDVQDIFNNLIQGKYKKSLDILNKALISNIDKNFNVEKVAQLMSNFDKNTFNQISDELKEVLDKKSKGLIKSLLQNSLIGFASLPEFFQNSRNSPYFAKIYKNFGFNETHLEDLLTSVDKVGQRFIVNSVKYNKIPVDFNKLDRSKLSPEISALISSNLSAEKLNRSEKNIDILFEQITKRVEEKVKKTSLKEQQEISQQPKKIEIDIT